MLTTLDKHKVSARVFLDDPIFPHVVDLCRLQSPDDWRVWGDNETKFIIFQDKKTGTYKRIDNKTHDIFKKAHPKTILDNSKWMCCLFNKTYKYIYFAGVDDVLRCCMFIKDEWEGNVSPISLGYSLVKNVVHCYINEEECFDNKFAETIISKLPYKGDEIRCLQMISQE